MSSARTEPGFTLIELMLGIVVLAVLLALAVPAFTGLFQKQRLKGAGERLASEIQFARSEAVATNTSISVKVMGGTDWCIGLSDAVPPADDCDCTSSGSCQVDSEDRVVVASSFDGVTRPADPMLVRFDGVRGLPDAAAGPALFDGENGKQIGVKVNPLGSVTVCSPAGTTKMGEYPDC